MHGLGDLRQTPLGALTVNLPIEAEHVVFHVHNDYVTRQPKHFIFRTGVAG